MAEKEKKEKGSGKKPGSDDGSPPAAEPKKSDNGDHMIPKARMDELLTKNKGLEDRLEALEAEQQKAVDEQLTKNKEWEELATKRGKELTTAQAEAKKVEAYEETLQKVLDTQLEEIPEEMRGLVPEQLTVQQRLNWLAEHKATLMLPSAPGDIGAGKLGVSGKKGAKAPAGFAAHAAGFGLKEDGQKGAAKRFADIQQEKQNG